MDENITFVGLNKLTDHESVAIRKISKNEMEKAARHLVEPKLKLRVKTINADGNRREYEFTALLESTQGKFESSNSGWDISVTLHGLFASLHNQAKKRLKMKE